MTGERAAEKPRRRTYPFVRACSFGQRTVAHEQDFSGSGSTDKSWGGMSLSVDRHSSVYPASCGSMRAKRSQNAHTSTRKVSPRRSHSVVATTASRPSACSARAMRTSCGTRREWGRGGVREDGGVILIAMRASLGSPVLHVQAAYHVNSFSVGLRRACSRDDGATQPVRLLRSARAKGAPGRPGAGSSRSAFRDGGAGQNSSRSLPLPVTLSWTPTARRACHTVATLIGKHGLPSQCSRVGN